MVNDQRATGEVHPRDRLALWLAVFISGGVGLTWEVLFQHEAALALGISAFGTAVTLAALMAGIGLGGLIAGRLSELGRVRRPLRAYGIAEITAGCAGLLVAPGLHVLGAIDTAIYARAPAVADGLRVLGVGALLLVPGVALGATLPLLAPWARRVGTTLPTLYALNTAGAVLGIALMTFGSLPLFGVLRTTWLAAATNFLVGAWAVTRAARVELEPVEAPCPWPKPSALGLAFASAFVVFMLEVSWFRSLRAAFHATTETFSILLAAFLLALSLGGWLAPRVFARSPEALPRVASWAAFMVMCETPLIDRVDLIASSENPALRFLIVFGFVLVPVTLTGMLFPWLLTQYATTRQSGRLYAINTLGAVLGALGAGFVLLPSIGATATSLAAGVVLVVVSLLSSRTRQRRVSSLLVAALGAFLALTRQEGSAQRRVQGFAPPDFGRVEFLAEGPESTVWVARERSSHRRALIIDGFRASGEGPGTDYMQWMGHLPALATPQLKRALVICFGTGQTAQAVRTHHAERLDIVDINAAVFAAAPLFQTNHGVLSDPRTQRWTMDGRAFLRRHPEARYDAVTLEPMPPNHAGVNNLYSREFYQLVDAHLQATGSIAQWLPLHLLAPEHMRAITEAFVTVFPHARLWIDPEGTGILVAAKQPWALRESDVPLPLPALAVSRRFLLEADALRALGADYPMVTDDNQLLSYGYARLSRSQGRGAQWWGELQRENVRILNSYATH